ncbi:MAG: hypothetical protein D9V44_08545 [Actinobacteria bacterium]|nr:MAG: hypothetical protein D9V44_08545 [Actinomycetota bacterium]
MSDELQNTEEPPTGEAAEEHPMVDEPDAAGDVPVAEEPEEPDAAGDVPVAEEPESAAQQAEPEETPVPVATPEGVPFSVSWVPFSVYLGLWVVLAVATVVLLRTPAAAGGALWAPEYALSVYGGVVLVALGPVLALVVWLIARSKAEPAHRTGLLTSALLRAAGATFIGVILWLVALYVLDLYRAGFHV